MNASPSIKLVQAQRPQQLGDLADDDLMLLARRERQDAFELLVQRHQGLVFGLCTRYLGDRVQGRDVTQDVFLALWAEKDRYRPSGKFRSYLVSMAMHRCHYVARQQRSNRDKVDQYKSSGAGEKSDPALPLAALVEHERAQEVRQALTQLPEKCREVMILRFNQELPLEEIAELTGMPLGTVKSHVFRGLQRLHAILQRG